MKNLKKALEAEAAKRIQEFETDLKKEKTILSILGQWRYKDLIPKSNTKDFATVKELKDYLLVRKNKNITKSLEKEIDRVTLVNDAKEVISISIGVEWKKNRTWGANPTATVEVRTKDGGFERYVGTASGCGYDKESAAIGQALNQSNAALKLLYTVKNKNITGNNRELLGYGSGSGLLPNFEGGVGFDCHRRIFEKLGYKTDRVASGKSFDAYTIKK